MQIAQALAGYSLGGADLLRRAMGKKKPEEMAKQKTIFLEGSKNNNVDEKDAETIFGLLEYFAGYGFNKSHSAAYALITYQTAYLKAHYPVELLCAILTSDKDRVEKVVRTIADARAMGITVLPPDADESELDFKVVYTNPKGDKPVRRSDRVKDKSGPQIRFGLGAVRGLGEGALETLFDARREGGPFVDLFDFASRVDAKKINKSVLEALVQCGAFDRTLNARSINRARAFASVDVALERSRSASRDREHGQTNLFGLMEQSTEAAGGDYPEAESWDRKETLAREKQALGFYVSGHPLDRYARSSGIMSKLELEPVAGLAAKKDWSVVKIAGVALGYREKMFRDGGGKIAFFDLEDLTGRVTCKLRSNAIDQFAPVLTLGDPVIITGKVQFPRRDEDAPEEDGPREPTILLNEAVLMADTFRKDARHMNLRMNEERITEDHLRRLKITLQAAKGNCSVSMVIEMKDGAEAVLALPKETRVEVGETLFSGIERIFGSQVAELR